MLYVIKHKNLYRCNGGHERWTKDLYAAAIFRTEANAIAKINEGRKKWARYAKEWVGHECLPTAVKTLKIWESATIQPIHLTESV